MTYPKPPEPFLNLVVHEINFSVPLLALCAGYESGNWRGEALAKHTMQWLPEFCLTAEELREFHPGTAVELIEKAAKLVYQTDKYQKRGEFGEIFLHIALRQVYQSIPAISKIYWKDSVNNTVKGFDAVHIVEISEKLELWLGEVKFYTNIRQAITDVIKELHQHTVTDYLRNEFMLITNKLDKKSKHFSALSKLLSANTSLDDVFNAICIPVLLTYDSNAVKGHSKSDPNYVEAITEEAKDILKEFSEKLHADSFPIKVHLFLLPLHTKEVLVGHLHEFLKRWQ